MTASTSTPLPDEPSLGRRGMPLEGADVPARAVFPPEADSPAMGQSPASPYTALIGDPVLYRPAPAPVVRVVPEAAPEPVVTPVEPVVVPEAPVELVEPEPVVSESVVSAPEVSEELHEDESVEDAPYQPESYEPEPDEDEPYEDELFEDELYEQVEVEPEPEPIPVVRRTPAPIIDRAPTGSASRSLSGAQAYTTPHDPSMWFIGPMEESVAPPFVRVRHQGPELVNRGLLFALAAVVVGWVVCAALFHFGHIPSIVALTIGPAGLLLYGKGAGSRPRAGAVRLVAMLVVGVLLAWPIALATELYLYYVSSTGTHDGVVGYVLSGVFSPSIFVAKLKEFLLVALFGLAGIIASLQTLLSTRRRKPARESEPEPVESVVD